MTLPLPSPNVFKIIESRMMGTACSTYGMRAGVQNFSWKPEVKRTSGTSRRRREDNTKMDLRAVEGCKCAEWIQLALYMIRWRTLVKTVMNVQISEQERDFLTS
jgi:hypothetical protein